MKQLKKQEASLVKCRHNIDPLELTELAELEGRITMVQNALRKGNLNVNEFGIFGLKDDEYIPIGFNAWRDSDGELTIGEVTDMDYFRIEGTDKHMRGIDVPPGFRECGDIAEQEEMLKKNMRAILQLFGIKVFVYPDHVEIKGAIPQQVLYNKEVQDSETAPIISSPSLS